MKLCFKYAASFTLILLVAVHLNCDAQILSPSLGWGTFVKGMSEVRNDFTLSGAPAGTVGVFFYFFLDTPSQPLWTQPDFVPSNGWIQGYDMGKLSPGAKLRAFCVNIAGDTIAQSPVYELSIISEPSWLAKSRISDVTVAGQIVTMLADYSIQTVLSERVPSDVQGIGGRNYSLFDPLIRMAIQYDPGTRISVVSTSSILFGVSLFNQKSAYRGIPLPTSNITFDQDFNLRIKAADSIYSRLLSLSVPLFTLPLPAFCDISFDAGVAVDGVLKGQVVVGNDGGQWGFVRDGTDITSLTAKLRAAGFIRGSFNVLGGLLLSIQGKLNIYGELGGGLEYVSIPFSETTTKFGGNLLVSGELSARAFLFFKKHLGPKVLYSTSFGQMPGRIVAIGQGGFLNTTTLLIDSTPPMPQYAPQPAIGTNAGDVGIAWIDSLNGYVGLWIAMKDSTAQGFRAPMLIASNNHGIGSPAVAVVQGGAFIAWTQNRYTPTTVPDGAGLGNLLAAQDIYAAFSDDSLRTISLPKMVPDDTSGLETGRVDAEPRICSINNDNAMLVWLAQEKGSGSSIWYAMLQRSGGSLNISAPMRIPGTTGMNRSPQLASLSGGRPLAIWMNDPDGLDTTYNSQVLSSVWNGHAWSAPTQVTRTGEQETITNTTLAAAGDYAVMGWTTTTRDSSGVVTSGIDVRLWSNASTEWQSSGRIALKDPTTYIQNPSITISSDGHAVVTYQSVPRSDTVAVDNGRRALLLRDLNDTARTWREVPGLPFLSDPTSYVWNALTAFSGNELYVLTEEQPQDGSTRIPENAVRFGSDDRGLVLRSIIVDADLSISDHTEPSTPVSGIVLERGAAVASIQVFPNPANENFTISYSLHRKASVTLELVDARGHSISPILSGTLAAGTYQTHVPTERLASGAYWIVLRSGADVEREAVLIVR